MLDHKGQIEVISSLHRDGEAIDYDIRFGVFVAFEADTDYIARCFREYGLQTDDSGRYAAMYKRWHLIGLELGISVANVALRGEPTGAATGWRADAVAVAKRDLAAGDLLDGEGGYTVSGHLMPAARSLAEGALPMGLTHRVRLVQPVARGKPCALVGRGSRCRPSGGAASPGDGRNQPAGPASGGRIARRFGRTGGAGFTAPGSCRSRGGIPPGTN